MPSKFKFGVGDIAIANTRARRELRGRRGIIIQIGPVKGEYGVEFADDRTPSLVYVEALKLDRFPFPEPSTQFGRLPVQFGTEKKPTRLLS
jgi:hypothetical protein